MNQPLVSQAADFGAPGDAVSVQGLPVSFVADLALRHFARQGELKLSTVAQYLGLPVPVVDKLLTHMRSLALLEVPRRGTLEGDISFALTDVGQRMARMAFEKCRYVGPAPVPLADYVAQVREQARQQLPVRAERLQQVLEDVVMAPEWLPTLGSALNSGRAIYLYGESGSGKTYLAEHMVRTLEGHIWVPHAVYVDGEVVQVFDPIVHRRVDLEPLHERALAHAGCADGRWVRAERPVVIAGGELTLDTLDLEYDPQTRFHNAPPQLKANNGIFVVDDLGRQRASPSQLMNRWIVPLDRQVDYLTLNTGTKFSVPFDVRVIFSSNQPPESLVDPAFARRLGYKIKLHALDATLYRRVVSQACARAGVPEDADAVQYLIHTLHTRDGCPYYPCVAFDVISKIADLDRYLGKPARMTPELLDWGWRAYFSSDDPQPVPSAFTPSGD